MFQLRSIYHPGMVLKQLNEKWCAALFWTLNHHDSEECKMALICQSDNSLLCWSLVLEKVLEKYWRLFDNFLNFILAWTYTKVKTHLVLEPVQLYTMFPVVCHFLLSRKKTFLFLKIMQMEFFQRHTFWWMQVQKLTVGKLTFHDSTLIELELDPFDDIRVVCLVWSKLHQFFHNMFYRLRSKQLTILLI